MDLVRIRGAMEKGAGIFLDAVEAQPLPAGLGGIGRPALFAGLEPTRPDECRGCAGTGHGVFAFPAAQQEAYPGTESALQETYRAGVVIYINRLLLYLTNPHDL